MNNYNVRRDFFFLSRNLILSVYSLFTDIDGFVFKNNQIFPVSGIFMSLIFGERTILGIVKYIIYLYIAKIHVIDEIKSIITDEL